MEELFTPRGVTWHSVSPRLAVKLRLVLCGSLAVLTVVGTVYFAVLSLPSWLAWLPWAIAVLGALSVVWYWFWAGRWSRAWGWIEREDDLYIKHGLLFRTVLAVPYGRMQYVDVLAGPLDRAFGIARVELHTATPATKARIPGLLPDQAAWLRDRLTERGEVHGAGL